MLYELRTYETLPGRLPALNRRFAEVTLKIFARYNMDVVGFWTNEIGGYSNELVYMMRFDDMADRERKWKAFGADEEWQKARAASEADGPLLLRISARFLRPTAYSPAQ
ncbi:MAG TPA: NIPSNAP family protein [Dehalococcoidia bacterium]